MASGRPALLSLHEVHHGNKRTIPPKRIHSVPASSKCKWPGSSPGDGWGNVSMGLFRESWEGPVFTRRVCGPDQLLHQEQSFPFDLEVSDGSCSEPRRNGSPPAGHDRDRSRSPARYWVTYPPGCICIFSVSRQSVGFRVGHSMDLGTASSGTGIFWTRNRKRWPEMGS